MSSFFIVFLHYWLLDNDLFLRFLSKIHCSYTYVCIYIYICILFSEYAEFCGKIEYVQWVVQCFGIVVLNMYVKWLEYQKFGIVEFMNLNDWIWNWFVYMIWNMFKGLTIILCMKLVMINYGYGICLKDWIWNWFVSGSCVMSLFMLFVL